MKTLKNQPDFDSESSGMIPGFKFSWIVYGVAAYYGLKYLNRRGILPDQTRMALDFIDRGVVFAKQQLGWSDTFSPSVKSSAQNSVSSSFPH